MAETVPLSASGARPSTNRAAALASSSNTGSGGGSQGIMQQLLGTGGLLGSGATDTLPAELGFGIDGRTLIPGPGGKDYIFSPVSFEDQEDAMADLNRLPTALVALGMAKPMAPLSDITASDVAKMMVAITGNTAISEAAACTNLMLLFYRFTPVQREAFSRMVWYSMRRWHDLLYPGEELPLAEVKRMLDFSNMPLFLRLFFRKNAGVLDRFLLRLSEVLPAPVAISEEDMQPTETEFTPEELAASILATHLTPGENDAYDEAQNEAEETEVQPEDIPLAPPEETATAPS